jgi:hypothetical protein
MYGKIKVLELDGNDMPQIPVGLEYGISLGLAITPLTQQLSNVFSPLADGTYYIWWRESGGEWTEAQVVKEVVLCQNIANNEALIQNYFDTYVWPVIGGITNIGIEGLATHNFIANDTSVGITAAINSIEDYSYLDMAKVVAVYVDGIFTPFKNAIPDGADTTTAIYNDAGIIKWKTIISGYELTTTQNISFVVVV